VIGSLNGSSAGAILLQCSIFNDLSVVISDRLLRVGVLTIEDVGELAEASAAFL
jgi:hypothetical protein